MTQTIEVTGETARLQNESAERSGLITLEQTQNVPLKGRDYLGLLKLLPVPGQSNNKRLRVSRQLVNQQEQSVTVWRDLDGT